MTGGAQASTSGRSDAPQQAEFRVSERYRYYVVWLLFVVYVFNFVDRQILTILIQPIKQEFGLSDAAIGALTGFVFAALYSTLGIPIARLADRRSRVNIITISLLAWSAFTALTGFARTFWQLVIARAAVGVGEAGFNPAAYAVISDYFEPKRRSTALSIYSMGISGGVFVGFLVGSHVAQAYGWRAAFYVVGLPGVILAAILKLTLREPPRGFSDAVPVTQEPPPMAEVFRALWAKPAFRHMSFAAALHAFVGYGVGGFNPAFLMRTHGMSVVEVGNWLAPVAAFGGSTGTFLGGWLADRYSNKTGDARYQVLVPAISTLINVPIALLVYFLPDRNAVLFAMVPAAVVTAMYLGPTFALTQGLVGTRERAVASALLLFIMNFIGLGLGPLLTGNLSDLFKHHLTTTGLGEVAATAAGLRWAMRTMVCVNLWSAFHYLRASRTLRADLVAS
jgi:MFS family permease